MKNKILNEIIYFSCNFFNHDEKITEAEGPE